MEPDKKELLVSQIEKLDEILNTLKENFDVKTDLADEYSFLSIVKSNLQEMIK